MVVDDCDDLNGTDEAPVNFLRVVLEGANAEDWHAIAANMRKLVVNFIMVSVR